MRIAQFDFVRQRDPSFEPMRICFFFFNRLQRRLLSGAFFNHVLLNNFDSNMARVLVVVSKLGKLYVR